jgi:hypothetical protein
MLNVPDVDLVVLTVRANPFDPNDALFEICGYDEPIAVALDVAPNLGASPWSSG